MKTRTHQTESGFTLIEVIVTLVMVAIVAAMMTAYFGKGISQSYFPISRLKKTASLNEVLERISAQYGQYSHWRPNTTYAAGTVILPTTQNRTGGLYRTVGGGTSGSSEPTNWLLSSVTDNTVTWTPYAAAPTLVLQDRVTSINYRINAAIVHGNYTYVTRTGGNSGTATLTWPTTVGGTVVDNTVTWTCSGPLTASPLQLQAYIGSEGTDQTKTFLDNKTLSYRVILNRFIYFDASNTENDTCTSGSCGATFNDYGRYLKVTIGFPLSDTNRTGETLTTLFVFR